MEDLTIGEGIIKSFKEIIEYEKGNKKAVVSKYDKNGNLIEEKEKYCFEE